MEARVQRVLIWSGPAMVVLWIGAFLLVAGFIPPHDPGLSADEIVDIYAKDSGSIKFGLIVSMAGSALLVPWAVAISGQLKRIDGARALADVQMASCALLSLEFIFPIGIWMATSYRFEERSPGVTQAMNDCGWMLFMAIIWSIMVQLIAIAWAIFIDRRNEPVLPRWLGYLTLWVAVLIMPAGTIVYFKDGPFAWNGLLGFYVPVAAFCVWLPALTWCVHCALTRQIADGSEPGALTPRRETAHAGR